MVDERLRRRGGDAAATPLDCILFDSIRIASFLRKVNVGSGTSFLPRARACTQFTSATDNRKVNCRLGHHFVCHTSSNPIGSCRRLLTSSTQCLARSLGGLGLPRGHRASTLSLLRSLYHGCSGSRNAPLPTPAQTFPSHPMASASCGCRCSLPGRTWASSAAS